MKDSQRAQQNLTSDDKYIKADNERFSTGGVFVVGVG